MLRMPSAYISASVTAKLRQSAHAAHENCQTMMGSKSCSQSDDTLGKEYCNTGSALLQRHILPDPQSVMFALLLHADSTIRLLPLHCIKLQQSPSAGTASVGLADHHASADCAGHTPGECIWWLHRDDRAAGAA